MRLWIASSIFYAFCFIVCEILRFCIGKFVDGNRHALAKALMLEFVGTLQICAPMFDVGLVLDNYGLLGVFIEITALELANAYLQRDAIAHPCPLVTSATRKKKAFKRLILVFLTQLAAAYASYFLARTFWKLGVHKKHLHLLHEKSCHSDLSVAITTGCLIEGTATFVCKAVEHLASKNYADSTLEKVINSSFAGLAVAIGIHYTGMYANPIVAWACTFNCEGATHWAHLGVYWLSPLIGWYLAEWAFEEKDEHVEREKEE